MNREYDLFECLPDGSTLWRCVAVGAFDAHLQLYELARTTANELFAIEVLTGEVLARVNTPLVSQQRNIKRIFQIAYDDKLHVTRAVQLRTHGYDVSSVVGNEAAKTVLGSVHDYDLFVVGHAAPEETRIEMVGWLKMKYPKARILAMNPPDCQCLDGADYNVPQNVPGELLRTVSAALG
jgi:hypothetical protein